MVIDGGDFLVLCNRNHARCHIGEHDLNIATMIIESLKRFRQVFIGLEHLALRAIEVTDHLIEAANPLVDLFGA